MRLIWNRDTAELAARHAGNRSALTHGRSFWDRADYLAAAKVYYEAMIEAAKPVIEHQQEESRL